MDQKIEVLQEIRQKDRLFRFLNWIEIKSQKALGENIESIIISIFKFSDSIHYQKEGFFSMDSDFMTLQRFCSRMLDRLNSFDDRRALIEKHITDAYKSLSFSSYYTIHSLLRAKELKVKGELYSNHMWHNIFSERQDDNDKFGKQLVEYYKTSIKKLFIEYSKNHTFLNGAELIFLLPDLKLHYSKFYDKEFKKLIADDQKLLEVLILCITTSYMTSGTVVGYQLTKYQLLEGMDVNEIKSRIEMMDMKGKSKDEVAASKFYLQAYKDGFEEKKYYDFYTLDDVGRW